MSKSFPYLTVAFAWAAIAVVVVASGTSFDAGSAIQQGDTAWEDQGRVGLPDPVFWEVTAVPGRPQLMTLAAAGEPEEDEEGGDEEEPSEETGEDSGGWDRLSDAPKLG